MGAAAFSAAWVSVVESVGSLRCARTRSASVTFLRGREAEPLAPVIPFVPLDLRAAVGFPRKPRSVFSGTGMRISGGMGPAARVTLSPSRMRPAERWPSPSRTGKASQVKLGRFPASVHGIGTPVMRISLWGLGPLCEIGISARSVYQMTTSRVQAYVMATSARTVCGGCLVTGILNRFMQFVVPGFGPSLLAMATPDLRV